MVIELQVSGGFSGPLGKKTVALDLEHLPAADAAALRSLVEGIPPASWGKDYLDPHPKPWQFRHQLRVIDGGAPRQAVFHLGLGPPALSIIAKQLLERDS